MSSSWKFVTTVVALMMVTVVLQPSVASIYDDVEDRGTRLGPTEEIPGPFRELDRLVADLQAATVDKTDTDGDSLYDRVEWIIGTDPENADTDLDLVPDMDEVINRTDPNNPDSNSDGIVDSQEVLYGVDDIDGDGMPNVWDPDNDGDGLTDSRDASPFSTTGANWSFRYDINTTGGPTTVTYQLRTSNPSHMRLINQTWDWPYDNKGNMMDLDNSKEDLTITPILELDGANMPYGPEMDEFGIVTAGNLACLPMYPIWEYGNVVALQAQMFYPANATPQRYTGNMSLKWKVTGFTDVKLVSFLALNGRYFSVHKDGILHASANELGENETFELVEVDDGRLALKAVNGYFVRSWKGDELRADASKMDKYTMFALKDLGPLYTGLVHEQSDQLVGFYGEDAWIVPLTEEQAAYGRGKLRCIDLGVRSTPITLAYYVDRFSVTGCVAEEDHGTDLSVTYHTSDLHKGWAANLYLSFQFMRNVSNNASDIPGLLRSEGFDVTSKVWSHDRMDLAVRALSNEIISKAKATFLQNRTLPIITVLQRHYSVFDLSSMGQGRLMIGTTLAMDVGSQPSVEKRYMKTGWYNSSEDEQVEMDIVLSEVQRSDLAPEDLGTVMALIVVWNAGEEVVVRIGKLTHRPDDAGSVEVMKISFKVVKYGITYARTISNYLRTAKQLVIIHQILKPIGGVLYFTQTSTAGFKAGIKFVSDSYQSVGKITKGFWGTVNQFNKVMKWMAIVGLVMDFAIIGLTLYCIGSSYDWSALGIYTVAVYGVMMSVWAVFMFALTLMSFIPDIGIIFTIFSLLLTLSDLACMLIFGKGWVQMVMDLMVDLLTDVRLVASHYFNINQKGELDQGETKVEIDDKDGNSLDVGDRINYLQIINYNTAGVGSTSDEINTTYLNPTIEMEAPRKSGSVTGSDRTVRVRWDQEGPQRRITHCEAKGWVEPGVAMINFPVTVCTSMEYKIIYEECYWFLGWQCKKKYIENTVHTDPFTMYFDVMPGSLDEFVRWRSIWPNDRDGDGLSNAEEGFATAYSWDTDGDGLADPYEMGIGTNPRHPDTDRDGIDDRTEHVRGTDPNTSDTDGDGLSDYFEHTGWVVSFVYEGQEFDWHINSDPRIVDTDGDGISDHLEYLTLQNPRSSDTNGDGGADPLIDYTMTTFEQRPSLDLGTRPQWPDSLAVTEDGIVYVGTGGFDWYPKAIRKYLPNGTFEREWGESPKVFAKLTGLTCDKEGNVYATDVDSGASEDLGKMVVKFDPNGTQLATYNGTGPMALENPMDMAIDEDGYMYVIDTDYQDTVPYERVVVLDRNGTYSHDFGSRGNGPGQLQGARGISIDGRGLLYVADTGNDRLQLFETDGTLVEIYDGTGPGGEVLSRPTSVAFDDMGGVFVVDSGNDRILKFDQEWRWIATLGGPGIEEDNFNYPKDAVVWNDKIYVTDSYNGKVKVFWQNVTVVQVDQKTFNDTDGDGLSDAIEDSERSINVTFETGLVQLNVTSDLNNPDTDGDGLNDLEEYNLSTDPGIADSDGDGMDDLEEVMAGTDPTHFDSDGDTLDDGLEVEIGSNPLNRDTDGEGLTDDKEFELGSDPADNDTDDDGLDDFKEYGFNSDIFNADSDDDFMFDSREFDLDILPNVSDYDEDGLIDGYEDVFETDAKVGDSDGDDLPDGFEVAMIMNPLSNDTDGDGVDDGVELDRGLNPRSGDSDGDGVPDGIDKDYELELEGDVYLVVDPRYDSVGFVEDLAKKVRVIIVTPEELMDRHKRARYIVILGDPTTEEGTAGSIIHSLLADAPDVRESMNGSEDAHMAIRYGKWASEQTIVMLSRAYHSDHFRVVGILKSMTVKITDGVLTYNYHNPRSCFKLDDIDTIKATDAAIWTQLDEMAVFSVDIAKYDEDDTPRRLTEDNGLEEDDRSIGKYVEVEVSENLLSEEGDLITGATIWVYYTLEDLDQTGDGDADDPVDIDEQTLGLYKFDKDEGRWVKLTDDLDWVEAVSIDTEDIEMYGESYAGVLRADITRLSLFSAGGRIQSDIVTTADPGDDLTATVGEPVTFDGTNSEGVGGIDRYTWTFMHNYRTVTLHGEEPIFTFMTEGEYVVTLRVRDNFGGVGTATFTVTVEPFNIMVRVGPVVDEDGVPLYDATIRVTWGEDVFKATTDFSGFVDLMIPTEAVGGDITVRVSKEGYEPQEFTTSFMEDGVLERQPSPMVASEVTEPPDKEAEGPAGWEYGIVVVMLVLVLLALLIFVGKRPSISGKKEDKAGGKEET